MSSSVENRGPGMIATTVLVSVLACVTVVLRLATRIWIVRSVGWDDYTILFAAFGLIIGAALVIVQVHYGFGRHRTDLSDWEYSEFQKFSYGEWIQTFQTLMLTKVSICFFLLRIPVERYLLRPIQGAIIALILSNVILTLLWIFQCNPIASSWNKQIPGHCFTDAQLQRIIISQALISIISDFMLALFPIVLLWKVQISLRVKAGLCILMGVGLITGACCIVRTVLNWQNVNSDASWESIDNWYWRSWEVCIGVIAACIPALRPGYRVVFTGITTYVSQHRSLLRLKSSEKAGAKDEGDGNSARHMVLHPSHRDQEQPQIASYDAAFKSVEAEARRAHEVGAGDDAFAMRDLPGEKRPVHALTDDPRPPLLPASLLGIRKETRIDITGQRNSDMQEDVERGELGSRDFL